MQALFAIHSVKSGMANGGHTVNAVWPLDTILFLDFNKAQGVKTVRTDGLDLFYFARQMNASVLYEISCSLSNVLSCSFPDDIR